MKRASDGVVAAGAGLGSDGAGTRVPGTCSTKGGVMGDEHAHRLTQFSHGAG